MAELRLNDILNGWVSSKLEDAKLCRKIWEDIVSTAS